MNKLLIVFLLLFCFCLSSFANENDSYYIKFEYLEFNNGQWDDIGFTRGFYSKLGTELQSVYYQNDQTKGTTSAMPDLPEPQYELYTRMALRRSQGELILKGFSYSMILDTDGNISIGKRTLIRKPISLDIPVIISLGISPNNLPISIRVLVSKESIERISNRNEPPFKLKWINNFLVNDKVHGSGYNSRPIIKDTTIIRTGFGTFTGDSKTDQVNYVVKVILTGYEQSTTGAYSGILRYLRYYEVDTAQTRGDEFVTDFAYVSEYAKQVNLIPGELFQLVIPPDSPAVRNFGFEDTLIFAP